MQSSEDRQPGEMNEPATPFHQHRLRRYGCYLDEKERTTRKAPQPLSVETKQQILAYNIAPGVVALQTDLRERYPPRHANKGVKPAPHTHRGRLRGAGNTWHKNSARPARAAPCHQRAQSRSGALRLRKKPVREDDKAKLRRQRQ